MAESAAAMPTQTTSTTSTAAQAVQTSVSTTVPSTKESPAEVKAPVVTEPVAAAAVPTVKSTLNPEAKDFVPKSIITAKPPASPGVHQPTSQSSNAGPKKAADVSFKDAKTNYPTTSQASGTPIFNPPHPYPPTPQAQFQLQQIYPPAIMSHNQSGVRYSAPVHPQHTYASPYGHGGQSNAAFPSGVVQQGQPPANLPSHTPPATHPSQLPPSHQGAPQQPGVHQTHPNQPAVSQHMHAAIGNPSPYHNHQAVSQGYGMYQPVPTSGPQPPLQPSPHNPPSASPSASGGAHHFYQPQPQQFPQTYYQHGPTVNGVPQPQYIFMPVNGAMHGQYHQPLIPGAGLPYYPTQGFPHGYPQQQ